jgi:serine/threonine protein kinase
VSQDLIDKEAKAIIKICGPKSHDHIVAVRQIGELRNTRYYFIDMELCDLNLSHYIYGTTLPVVSESVPCFIKNAVPPLKAQQVWNVMLHIASGLQYLHSLCVAHRDLKPDNGAFDLSL